MLAMPGLMQIKPADVGTRTGPRRGKNVDA